MNDETQNLWMVSGGAKMVSGLYRFQNVPTLVPGSHLAEWVSGVLRGSLVPIVVYVSPVTVTRGVVAMAGEPHAVTSMADFEAWAREAQPL